MSPHQKSEHRDRKACERDKFVSENPFTRKACHQFANNSHAGQDHDVDGRMRIEPEQMLKQQRISAKFWVEDADMEATFNTDEQQRYRDHGSAKHHDQGGRIIRPDKQGQPKPRQSGGPHLMSGNDEVQTRED